MTTPDTAPQRFNSSSYVSIGLAVAIIGGVVVLRSEVSAVRNELLPKVATIEERVRGIALQMSALTSAVRNCVPREDIRAMIDAAHAQIRADLEQHRRRLEALEKR